jgi:CheY-like chemotaxis protein
MIADAGFDVVEAASADEAIVILEDRFDITVVFSDIQMPGGGAERPPLSRSRYILRPIVNG